MTNYYRMSQRDYKPVLFVSPSNNTSPTGKIPKTDKYFTRTANHSGAKEFYEEVVGEGHTETGDPVKTNTTSARKCHRKGRQKGASNSLPTQDKYKSIIDNIGSSTAKYSFDRMSSSGQLTDSTGIMSSLNCKTPNISVFLKHAQHGDTSAMFSDLQSGVDLNGTDEYHWTALMCASYSGSHKAVDMLLRERCNTSVEDFQRRTALQLACIAKHYDIVELIERHCTLLSENFVESCESDSDESVETPAYCDECRVSYMDSTTEHRASTIHMLNRNKALPGTSTVYGIPESNRGFQIMLRAGWDKQGGLGSQGLGHKFPVKTLLKRDRKGIGCEPTAKRSKVTHFQANDESAVKRDSIMNPVRTLRSATESKKQQERTNRKERKLEINFRNEFNAI